MASYLIIKQLKYGRSDTESEDDDDDDISEQEDRNSDMMIHHDGPKPFQFFLADGSIAPSGVGGNVVTMATVTGEGDHHHANKEKSGGGVVAE